MNGYFEEFLTYLYDGVLSDEIYSKALLIASKAIQADSIHLFALNPDRLALSLFQTSDVKPNLRQRFADEYMRIVRADKALQSCMPNRLLIREMRRPFFALNAKQAATTSPSIYRVMGANIGTEDNPVWFGISSMKADSGFSPQQQKIVSQMIPHVSRSLRLYRQCTATQSKLHILSDLLNRTETGILITSSNGMVFANSQAQAILSNDFFYQRHNQLACRDHEAQQSLDQASSNAHGSGQGVAVLRDETQQVTYYVSISPYDGLTCQKQSTQNSQLLYKITPALSQSTPARSVTDAFCAAHNLTQAETRVMGIVLAKNSLSDWAKKHNVRVDTLRKQLKAGMKKTHSHSQKDLLQQFERFRIAVESNLPAPTSPKPAHEYLTHDLQTHFS